MITALYESKIIVFFAVMADILIGVFAVLYYSTRYGPPKAGNKKWESQRAYRNYYTFLAYIFEGIIVITLFILTNFLYDKNLNASEVIIVEFVSLFALMLIGLSIGEYFRAKKFNLTLRYAFINGPKK